MLFLFLIFNKKKEKKDELRHTSWKKSRDMLSFGQKKNITHRKTLQCYNNKSAQQEWSQLENLLKSLYTSTLYTTHSCLHLPSSEHLTLSLQLHLAITLLFSLFSLAILLLFIMQLMLGIQL